MSFKELSNYYNDDKTRTATVRKEIGTNRFVVSVMNESGHSFSASYETEDDAEAFAEDWVLK
jgi:hypothetical protein